MHLDDNRRATCHYIINPLHIPDDVAYEDVGGLRAEDVETLNRHRPETLGAANRLAGVTPAARLALLRYAQKRASTASSGE